MSIEEFTRIEQPPGSKLCLACVVAMLADTSLEDVLQRCDHHDAGTPLPFSTAANFLASRRWHIGMMLHGRFALLKGLVFLLIHRRYGAILFVRPSNGEGTHAVLWTGERIFDPAPGAEGKKLNDYQVLEWWPLVKVC